MDGGLAGGAGGGWVVVVVVGATTGIRVVVVDVGLRASKLAFLVLAPWRWFLACLLETFETYQALQIVTVEVPVTVNVVGCLHC